MRGLNQKLIHIWVPDFESSNGGIQSFSRFFIRAIRELLPGADILILSKNDATTPPSISQSRKVRFDCCGWWSQWERTAAYTLQLTSYALRERPAVILSTHVNFLRVARWLKSISGCCYAAVAHGVDVWGLKDRRLRDALRRADRLIAVSHFTRNRMIEELSLSPEKVGLLPNTFDPKAFEPTPKPHFLLQRFGLTPDQPVILTVARLASQERYKGHDQVLHALPGILRAIPSVRYIIGGRGPDRARIEALVRELHLENSVTLAGYIPDHELSAFYNLCDVFAMPSKGEGFGIVFLEALGCGKPIVAGNKDGSVDAVLNGKLGVLVDPDNVAEIGAALTQILQRSHPLEILQRPEELRRGVLDAFGYPRFIRAVAANLTELRVECETSSLNGDRA